MSHIVHSAITAQLRPVCQRLPLGLGRIGLPILLGLCYTGVFLAPGVIEFLPITAILRFKNGGSSASVRIAEIVVLTAMLLVCGIFGRRIYRLLQNRTVSVDALVLEAGCVFAVLAAIWLFSS